MGIIERIKDKPHEINDTLAAQIRLKYMDRWIARTRDELGLNCDCWEQIAFDDPQISLEFKLCDPANIVMLQSKKMRNKFIESLTDAERDYLFSDPDALAEFQTNKLTRALRRKR